MDYGEVLRASAERGYRVPRLAELLQLASGRIGLDVELKETGYEEIVLRLIFDDFRAVNFFITSFESAALSAIRELNSGVRLGFLMSDVSGTEALKAFQEVEADFLAPESTCLTDAVFREAEKRAIPLLPWAVDDPALIRQYLREDSIFGVITDHPDQALQIRTLGAARPPAHGFGSDFQKS
jgi:glycerophosphoryl diester phosphodiesterase